MHRKLPFISSVALGAVMLVAPTLSNLSSDSIYDSAFAAKGGNGNGGANGNGNGGNGNGNGNANGGAIGSGGVASTGATNKEKMSAKQLALTDPTAPAHPSMLGRWNATKPFGHPSIQAHIRNGNYNGTIGMLAAFGQAVNTMNTAQDAMAAADPAVMALAQALKTAGYSSLADYQAAALPDASVDAAIATFGGVLPSDTDITAAQALIDQNATAAADLEAAEGIMAAHSNRAPWGDIRDDVLVRMGLEDPLAPTP